MIGGAEIHHLPRLAFVAQIPAKLLLAGQKND
jgi:hypothetical protein